MFLWYQIEMNIQLSLSGLIPAARAGILAVPSGESQGSLRSLHVIHIEEMSDPFREVVWDSSRSHSVPVPAA